MTDGNASGIGNRESRASEDIRTHATPDSRFPTLPAIPMGALIAYPTSVDEVRDIVRDAASRRAPVRIVGHGTWLGAGRPVDARASRVVLESLRGITEYVPGDLTLTALAGTPLSEIARATAEHGQWLTLDPFGAANGSIGAAFATASSGPLAAGFGTPRDLALGVEILTGDGKIVRGGGRVVKNVAGFDLTRLAVGSWGTLGILTEITVRLRARPERDVTLAIATPDARAVAALAQAVRTALIGPASLEALSPALASRLALGAGGVTLARLCGNAPAVEAQRTAIAAFAEYHEVDGALWSSFATCERDDDAGVVRLGARPSRIDETWSAALAAITASRDGIAHANVVRGIARCIVPSTDASALASAVASFGGSRVFERLPASLWETVAPSAMNDRLSRDIRATFDPHGILNPGILGPIET